MGKLTVAIEKKNGKNWSFSPWYSFLHPFISHVSRIPFAAYAKMPSCFFFLLLPESSERLELTHTVFTWLKEVSEYLPKRNESSEWTLLRDTLLANACLISPLGFFLGLLFKICSCFFQLLRLQNGSQLFLASLRPWILFRCHFHSMLIWEEEGEGRGENKSG